MKMKNTRFLALVAIFFTGSIAPKPGISHQGVIVIAGGLVGLMVGMPLGSEKGAALAKSYEQSLGRLAVPAELAGALLGMPVGGAMGAAVGFVGTLITTEVAMFIGKKLKEAKTKLEKIKQQYL